MIRFWVRLKAPAGRQLKSRARPHRLKMNLRMVLRQVCRADQTTGGTQLHGSRIALVYTHAATQITVAVIRTGIEARHEA